MSVAEAATLGVDPNPQNIVAGCYAIDPAHTRVLFNVLHFGVSRYWGEFLEPSGVLNIDPADPEGVVLEVSVPTAKISTNSKVLDDELRSVEWFDAQVFPLITLRVAGAALNTERQATITGDLTIHGVTRPVRFTVDFIAGCRNPFSGQPTIGFEAAATIHRKEFGVGAKIPVVSDTVNIVVSASLDLVVSG